MQDTKFVLLANKLDKGRNGTVIKELNLRIEKSVQEILKQFEKDPQPRPSLTHLIKATYLVDETEEAQVGP